MGAASLCALAEEKTPAPGKPSSPAAEEQFKKLDKDKDQKLTEKELFAQTGGKAVGRLAGLFAGADKNKDGTLTLDEYKEFLAAQKKMEKDF